MIDHPRDTAGEEAEAAADAANEKGIEAVEAGKNFAMKLVTLIGLFAEKKGVDVGTVEKDDPVASEFGMKDGDKIDFRGAMGRFAFTPDANGV